MKRSPRGKKPAPPTESEIMARIVAEAALDVKAEDVVALKVSEHVTYTDYFVIASGRSTRQAQAIADNIQKVIHQQGDRILGLEGERDGNWVLIDWGSVVAHVFYRPVREFYEIEKLWGDAPRLPIKDPASSPK